MKKKLVVIFCLCLALMVTGCNGLLSELGAENSLSESISINPETSSQQKGSEPKQSAAPSEPAPAATDNAEQESGGIDRLLGAYYRSADAPVTDPHSLLEAGVRVDETKLIPIYATSTEGREALLGLCERLNSGERLHQLMEEDGRWYTVLTDESGQETSCCAIIDPSNLTVMEYSTLNEYTRREFGANKAAEQLIAQGKLDGDRAEMAHCVITGFAAGNLLWDDEQEYFVPSLKDYTGLVELGKIYTAAEIAGIIQENIDMIFSWSGGAVVE